MTPLSPLELAAARRLAVQISNDQGSRLLAQLETAKVASREFTGVGFFTTLSVDRDLAPASVAYCPDGWVRSLVGPAQFPLEFMLYVQDGYADTIEAYSFEDGYGDIDLLTCKFTEPADLSKPAPPLS